MGTRDEGVAIWDVGMGPKQAFFWWSGCRGGGGGVPALCPPPPPEQPPIPQTRGQANSGSGSV